MILGVFEGIRVSVIDASEAHCGERLLAFESGIGGMSLSEREVREIAVLGEDEAAEGTILAEVTKVLRPVLDALEEKT